MNCNRGFPGKNVLLRCDHTVEVVESRRCNSAAMAKISATSTLLRCFYISSCCCGNGSSAKLEALFFLQLMERKLFRTICVFTFWHPALENVILNISIKITLYVQRNKRESRDYLNAAPQQCGSTPPSGSGTSPHQSLILA